MAKILVVDDNKLSREAAERLLSNDHNVITATNGVEGETAAIEQGPFDLIMTDNSMERADAGIAMAKRLRERGILTPILMHSGTSMPQAQKLELQRQGIITGFCEKDTPPQKLLAVVDDLTRQQPESAVQLG